MNEKTPPPTQPNSRLPDFRRGSLAARREQLARELGLDASALALFDGGGLELGTADQMIENVIGLLGFPLGIALNFVVNGRDVLVPMCVEEPSVVAAASNAAKLVRAGGGFTATSTPPVMLAQVELRGVAHTAERARVLQDHADALCRAVDAALPGLVRRGGGARGLTVRELEPAGPADGPCGRLVVHLQVDCRDAMGANLCNTAAEAVAPRIAELAGGTAGLRILSNLSDLRRTTVSALVPFAALRRGDTPGGPATTAAPGAIAAGADASDALGGDVVAAAIAEAARFAELDPYRAATHNKGIMNGIDAVALATGQDWRALEAGAHAYAATVSAERRYVPLSRWWVDETAQALRGELSLPLAVGTVGGALRLHAGVALALRVAGSPDATGLGQVMAAAGLASNLAALRALATEGIQKGHMALHHRYLGESGNSR